MAAAEFARWFMALYFLGVAGFYTVRILAEKRRSGTSPVFAGSPGTPHWLTHLTFRVFRIAILLVCLVRLAWPEFDRFLVPFAALWHPAVLVAGDALLVAGFSAVLLLHFAMGSDWRSGIHADDRTRPITTGPFAVSRNPMTLGVIAAQIGLFLALPSLFTLICLAFGVAAVIAQVGVEERLLRQRFGSEYEAYAARTPRWLGFR